MSPESFGHSGNVGSSFAWADPPHDLAVAVIFNGIVDYRRPVGQGLFTASLDWAYHDEKSFFLYESKEFVADSLEIGARLGWVFAEARYEMALFARNLLDEEIVQNGIDFNNLTGFINEPRTWGVQFKAQF